MEKYFVADLADASRRANAYGQATDGFFDFEHFLSEPEKQTLDDNITLAQNSELQASVPQATLVANGAVPNQNTSRSKAAIRAQLNREKLKKRKIEMEGNIGALTQENKVLKDENEALKGENTHMNLILQSQAKEIDQLKRDHNRLDHEHEKQNVLVQTLSEILAGFDQSLPEKIQKLQNENDLLRQGIGAANLESQLVEEIQENKKLKRKMRIMEAQLSAVSEKLIILEDKLSERS